MSRSETFWGRHWNEFQKNRRLMFFLLIVAFFLLTFTIWVIATVFGDPEINNDLYINVGVLKEKHPELQEIIEEKMYDGVLNESEYVLILEKVPSE